MITTKPINEQIVEKRKDKGWSQNELARQSGLSQSRVHKAENGGNVTKNTLKQIADALGIELKIT